MNIERRRRRRHPRRMGVFYFLVPILLIGAMVAGWALWGPKPLPPKEIIMAFQPQETSTQIAERLYREKLVWNPQIFLEEARLQHLDTFFKGGEYFISNQVPLSQLVSQLKEHRVLRYQFTFPEGITVRQMAERLAVTPLESLVGTRSATPFVDKESFLQLALEGKDRFSDGFQKGNPTTSLEGYFLPGTYSLERMSAEDAVRTLLEPLETQVPTSWLSRGEELGMTFHQVLTLASIIEKEVQDRTESPTISSVFHNRLRDGMLLQSDPTVEYAIGSHHFPLTQEELATDSPYNTYLYPGLPPGPICNPTLDSIRAALYPASTDYYYFVATQNGTHLFAETYAEHQANIEQIWGSP
jgi:UPF0755 protein